MTDLSYQKNNIFRFTRPLPENKVYPFFNSILNIVEKTTYLDYLNQTYNNVLNNYTNQEFEDKILSELGIEYILDEKKIQNIPEQGPLMIVCNHPFGAIEGIILSSLIRKRRKDYKILANYLLSRIPELQDRFIFVDPFNKTNSIKNNVKPLMESIRYLQAGGVVAVFPSGEVSSLNMKIRKVTDPEWNTNAARIAQMAKAPVLTIHFHGSNSKLFHFTGLINPKLRTVMLPKEFVNKKNNKIMLTIGNLISSKKIQKFSDPKSLTAYLRFKTYLLANSLKDNTKISQDNNIIAEELALNPEQSLLIKEIESLKNNKLIEAGDYAVYNANSEDIPFLITELGIAREETFRKIGEGTGMKMDLDSFDEYYNHLLLWNKKDNKLAGAYRIGRTDKILKKFGKKGLYTSTLFKYSKQFFKEVGPALELGRSFVRAEYQRSFLPLMLLWKGICEFIAQNPKYTVLFGPVSISNEFSDLSQKLMMDFLIKKHLDTNLKKYVKARNKAKFSFGKIDISENDFIDISQFDDLSAVVSEVEKDGKSAPILLKQYLKLQGKVVKFNRDPDFSDVLDALIVVDLKVTPKDALEPYFQKDSLDKFYLYNHIEK